MADLTVYYANVNGIRPSFDPEQPKERSVLKLQVARLRPDVLVLSETHLREDEDFVIRGYYGVLPTLGTPTSPASPGQ